MHITRHADVRMNQRGIRRELVALTLQHGSQIGDRIILGRKEAGKRLEELKRETKALEQVLRKGGVTVVCDGATLITTYPGANFREER